MINLKNPYMYVLSALEYGDFHDEIIFHEKKFSALEFRYLANLAKKILQEENPKHSNFDLFELAEKMCLEYEFYFIQSTEVIHSENLSFDADF